MRELDADTAVLDNKKTMNAKAETIGTGKASDAGLLTLAVLIVVAGVAAYYLMPATVPSVLHTLSVVGAIVVACAIAWFTTPGRGVRNYLRETQFELRKVVWPTREETIRTTLIVIVVVVLLSIVLGLIDILLKWAILDHLLKL
ncbi:MAG TPA: preprotein translocase subunit SecE [Rhodanobacteraceae bacterium]|jgi:preprotein translocase subunit SecE|nr:preprotein translocase subunit SecE [Rhodanobacteraceae bacterium]